MQATVLAGGSAASTASAGLTLSRPARPAKKNLVKPTVTPRGPAGTDQVRFKQSHVRVEIDHNRPIAVELELRIGVHKAVENHLTTVRNNNPGKLPAAGQGSTSPPVGTRAAHRHHRELDRRQQRRARAPAAGLPAGLAIRLYPTRVLLGTSPDEQPLLVRGDGAATVVGGGVGPLVLTDPFALGGPPVRTGSRGSARTRR